MMRKINRCCIKAPERLNSAEIVPKTFAKFFEGVNYFIIVTGVVTGIYSNHLKYWTLGLVPPTLGDAAHLTKQWTQLQFQK